LICTLRRFRDFSIFRSIIYTPRRLIVNYFQENPIENMIVVAPDTGGAERARAYAKRLDAGLALCDKRREKANVAEVMNVVGDVKAKIV
jgi:ribose-phosphate pyrophosphokinase